VARSRTGEPFVVAVDAGGTHTRAACLALDGSLLSRATGGAGALHHDRDAARHVAEAVSGALDAGGLDAGDALGLAAGVAGISRPGSPQDSAERTGAWAESFYALPFLDCPLVFVNDAVTAHRGALGGEPGVVVVAGTGSMVLAVTEEGLQVESGQFEHYAGGARHLAYDVMHQVLMGRAVAADAGLVAAALDHWGVRDLPGLRRAVLGLGVLERGEVTRRYGRLAPRVTAAADTSPLADRALRSLAERTAGGVLVLAPLVGADPVPVTVAGALASDPAFVARLRESLVVEGARSTRLVPPALGPLGGAALLAYDLAGIIPGSEVMGRLRSAT